MKRIFATFTIACCLSHVAFGGTSDLLKSRAEKAVEMMHRGLSSVTAKFLDPPTPPTPGTTTAVLGECKLSTTITGDCASVVANSDNCNTVASTGCQALTSTQQCQDATYPARCATQIENRYTCSVNSCIIMTVNQICDTDAEHCAQTVAVGCDGWTHRQGMCKTNTPFCGAATLAAGCRTSVQGSDGCTSNQTYTIACITTNGGGSDCTSQGACLRTYGKNCITAAPNNTGMCGAISAASGTECRRISNNPNDPETPGEELLLLGGIVPLAILGRRFGLTL